MNSKKTLNSLVVTVSLIGLMGGKARADDSVAITLKARTTQVCNLSFQEIEYTSSKSGYTVEMAPVKLPGTSYRVMAPRGLVRSAPVVAAEPNLKSAVAASVSATAAPNPAIPLIGAFPILSMDKDPVQAQTEFCDYVQKYRTAFKAATVSSLVTNDVVKIKITAGAVAVTLPKASFTLPATVRTAPKVAVLTKTPADEITPVPADYVIIVQDIYYPDVLPLATYRTNQGYRVEVKKISTLPGYNATATPPVECTGVYERECYHLWNEPIVATGGKGAASKYTIPSMFGMRRQTLVGQTYTRVTSMAGIIRAYLRRKKALNPNFKAAFLVGDPEVIPASAYLADGGYAYGLHTGTDLYYALPTIPLLPLSTSTVSTAMEGMYPWMVRCQNTTTQVKTYRKWCLPGENLINGDWLNTWYSPLHPIKRGYPNLPCYGTNYVSGCISNHASNLIAVGRLVTQSALKPGGHDPGVTNYVNKLIYWESHLPAMTGGSAIFTFGGNELWLWNMPDIGALYANYGSTSKIYASQDYFATNGSSACSSHLCTSNCPTCSYKISDDIIDELKVQTRTAWYLNGHGGHNGIQGTYNTANPPASTGFSVGHQYFVDSHGYIGPAGLLRTTGTPHHSVINEMAGSNNLIGHVVANSCDPASFSLYDKLPRDFVAMDPTAEQASFQENLLSMPSGGAINTFLNVNVGWGFSDNAVNRLYMSKVHEAWSQCGRMGDAFLKFATAEANGDDWALHNRFLGGDPLAKIARPGLNCSPTTGDPVPSTTESTQ